jgi:hypothetical protein
MNETIDLSEQNVAALEAQARAAQMPAETYLGKIVARALHGDQSAEQPLKPEKSAYGLLAKYPAPRKKRSTRTGGKCLPALAASRRDRGRCRHARGPLVSTEKSHAFDHGQTFH